MNQRLGFLSTLLALGFLFLMQSPSIDAKEVFGRLGISILAGSFAFIPNVFPMKESATKVSMWFFVLFVVLAMIVGVGVGILVRR